MAPFTYKDSKVKLGESLETVPHDRLSYHSKMKSVSCEHTSLESCRYELFNVDEALRLFSSIGLSSLND